MKRTKLVTVPRRRFSAATYAGIISKQAGICGCGCGEPLGTDPRAFEYDHEIELAIGGKDEPSNLRAVLKRHHLNKTQGRAATIAKVRRIVSKGGLRRRDMNANEKQLAKLLEAKSP